MEKQENKMNTEQEYAEEIQLLENGDITYSDLGEWVYGNLFPELLDDSEIKEFKAQLATAKDALYTLGNYCEGKTTPREREMMDIAYEAYMKLGGFDND
jgi:hypothetical protein